MDVLCIEYDRKKKGLNIDKIAHMFEFGGTTQVYKLISSLEKKEYIKRKGNEIVISREGKKKLFSFREDGNKQSKKEFSSQIPIDYYNDTKIKEIEVFIGTFFFAFSFGFVYLRFNNHTRKNRRALTTSYYNLHNNFLICWDYPLFLIFLCICFNVEFYYHGDRNYSRTNFL